MLPFTFACQKQSEEVNFAENASSAVSAGNGSLLLQFSSPLAGPVPQGMIPVSINVTAINKLQSLRLLINDTQVKLFTTVPLEFQFDPALYSGDIRLTAESKDLNGNLNTETIVLTRDQVTNCMNDNTFDACVFWKNPVAQRKSAFARPLRFGDDLSAIQTFGIKLRNQTSPNSLRNNSITVTASAGQTAVPIGNTWKFPYQTDTKHFNAQLMAYHWLTMQETEMVRRSGAFFARNKNIQVDAYNSSVPNNAYWDGQKIVMGYAGNTGNPSHEMALSAEIYLHEMGHANLEFAVGGFQYISPNSTYGNNTNCRSSAGCIGGINEGQADFHSVIIFNDATPVGETWRNNLGGLSGRDVSKNQTLTAGQAFSKNSGEVHDMGAFYAAVLWSIYSNPAVTKNDFEKIFTAHLQKLTGSSRFAEARDALIASDLVLFNGKYANIIQIAFSQKGI